MRIFILSIALFFTIGLTSFFLIEKKQTPVKSKSKDTTIDAIQYLEKIDAPELSLDAIKEIFGDKSSSPLSVNNMRSIYVLKGLDQKTGISSEAIEYVNQLANQDLQQLRLGLIYHDMKLKNEARLCWNKSSLIEAKNMIARSYMSEYKYREAYDFLKDINTQENLSHNFYTLNAIYSLELIQNLNKSSVLTATQITSRYPDNLEWKLKQAIMHLSTKNYQVAHDQLAEIIFSRELGVNNLACAYNARMYLFYARLQLQGSNLYIDDILMAANKDCKAIFDISGKSQYFELFINQKIIEKEIQFYSNFKAYLHGDRTIKFKLNTANHIVENFLNSRVLIMSNKLFEAMSFLQTSEANRKMDQLLGVHYGFINSPVYLYNNALVLNLSGRYQSSQKVLAQIHKKSYSEESVALYNKNKIQGDVKKNSAYQQKKLKKPQVKADNLIEVMNQSKDINETKKQLIKANLLVKTQASEAVAIWTKLNSQGNEDAATDLALYLYSKNKLTDATKILKPYLNTNVCSRKILLCSAWIKSQENDFAGMQNDLARLIKINDAEAILMLATKAYELKKYTESFQYAQGLILAHGNLNQALIIKAQSLIKIYQSFPNVENYYLIETTLAQIKSIEIQNDINFLSLISEMHYCLGNHSKSLDYARKSDNKKLIKKNISRVLIKTPLNQWDTILNNDRQLIAFHELEYLKLANVIENKQYKKALEMIGEKTDPKSLHFKCLSLHALSLHEERDEIISKTNKPFNLWQSLAQFSFKQGDFTQAAKCFHQALQLQENNTLISNNYLSCLLKAKDDKVLQYLSLAQLNYQRAPTQQTLDTLVQILKINGNNKELQTLLKQKDNLNIEQELILADTYKSTNPKIYKRMLTQLLTNRDLVWDETRKNEVLRCLKKHTENL
ncbi:hypothetical protein PQO01_19920 [Lentisphaera marina]|uniref:hypothetical protein n=1 Tax=Lentisphaera marina TaxID=1111041 RepID=UPI0023650A9E|nr:hypothetical protein [Lentisphaera marina]MDD7987226.1 hypothetical protein [Lentisphaera marina]